MIRQLKVKAIRFFWRKESLAHTRARIRRDLRTMGKSFRQELMFRQGDIT